MVFLMLSVIASSCVTYGELLYFREKDTERNLSTAEIANQIALTIQKNDVLSITVHSFDQELAMPFNLIDSRMSANTGGQTASPFITYQVDEKGQIDFPVLGAINVEGLTISEAKDSITTKLQEYLKDPVINMRLVNFRIVVIGEVNRPGIFTINNDRITLLEALSLAGDLTPYSNRYNILIIREQNSERTFGEVNIKATDFLRSEFFYLRQGDVVYVEPTKDKEATVRDQFTEYIPWITAALQTITTVITIIAVFGNN